MYVTLKVWLAYILIHVLIVYWCIQPCEPNNTCSESLDNLPEVSTYAFIINYVDVYNNPTAYWLRWIRFCKSHTYAITCTYLICTAYGYNNYYIPTVYFLTWINQVYNARDCKVRLQYILNAELYLPHIQYNYRDKQLISAYCKKRIAEMTQVRHHYSSVDLMWNKPM